jgi:hypothetical protein
MAVAAKKANVISGIDPAEVDALRSSQMAAVESKIEAETALKAARNEVGDLKAHLAAAQESARISSEKREVRISELKSSRDRLEDRVKKQEGLEGQTELLREEVAVLSAANQDMTNCAAEANALRIQVPALTLTLTPSPNPNLCTNPTGPPLRRWP